MMGFTLEDGKKPEGGGILFFSAAYKKGGFAHFCKKNCNSEAE